MGRGGGRGRGFFPWDFTMCCSTFQSFISNACFLIAHCHVTCFYQSECSKQGGLLTEYSCLFLYPNKAVSQSCTVAVKVNDSGGPLDNQTWLQTANCNKIFQSLVFALTQLHYGQWSSLPFCLLSLVFQWPNRIFFKARPHMVGTSLLHSLRVLPPSLPPSLTHSVYQARFIST